MNIYEIKSELEEAMGVQELSGEILDAIETLRVKVFRSNYYKTKYSEGLDKFKKELNTRVLQDFSPAKLQEYASWVNDSYEIAGANGSSVLHNLHSMGDLVAQLINKTVLNDSISDVHNVSIWKVKSELKNKIDNGDTKCSGLLNEINRFLGTYDWRYVNGFVNVEKHHSLIKYNTNQTPFKPDFEFYFSEFTYNRRHFNKEEMTQLLKERMLSFSKWLDNIFKEIINCY
ncbi:hypothetical protein ACFVP8_22050 [Viridibacillus arvi]|uniref:hypothetical protein n=1 Tax=Viridibacillus arvi TaxID=263475 RepID=UPI00367D6C25